MQAFFVAFAGAEAAAREDEFALAIAALQQQDVREAVVVDENDCGDGTPYAALFVVVAKDLGELGG